MDKRKNFIKEIIKEAIHDIMSSQKICDKNEKKHQGENVDVRELLLDDVTELLNEIHQILNINF